MDRCRQRKWLPTGPSRERALNANGEQRHIGSLGQGAETWFEWGHFAISRAGSFREDQHQLSSFQPPQCLFQPSQAEPFSVYGNCIEGLNQQTEGSKGEQGFSRQIVQTP